MSNKTTFLSFSQNKKIEIPIFQRDYAQGRNDETTDKIRKYFINKIMGGTKMGKHEKAPKAL